nr:MULTISPECIES: hypothetical protein [unclassified Pseudoalteromonas]
MRLIVIVFLSIFFALSLYIRAIKKGMPTKRWFIIGSLLGPLAFIMFNLHYRRALLRCIPEHAILWRT